MDEFEQEFAAEKPVNSPWMLFWDSVKEWYEAQVE